MIKIFFQGDSITDADRDRSDNHFLHGFSLCTKELLGDSFEYLISSDNENTELKKQIIEDIAGLIATALSEEGLLDKPDTELERAAYSVNSKINDTAIRNLNILYGV